MQQTEVTLSNHAGCENSTCAPLLDIGGKLQDCSGKSKIGPQRVEISGNWWRNSTGPHVPVGRSHKLFKPEIILQFNHSFGREALGEMDKETKTGTPLD
jgi:hypothetical protein